jgi:hypothetical protein
MMYDLRIAFHRESGPALTTWIGSVCEHSIGAGEVTLMKEVLARRVVPHGEKHGLEPKNRLTHDANVRVSPTSESRRS